MKKITNISLATLLAISSMPLHVLAANNMIITSPIVPGAGCNPCGSSDIKQIKADVLNQERMNRDEEHLTRELAQENVALINKIQETQAKAALTSTQVKSGDLYTSIEHMTQLRDAMQLFNMQLDERNQKRMAQNEELIALRARIDKLEHLYGDVTSLDNTVQSVKYLPNLNDPKEAALLAQFETQEEFLIFKSKTLVQQYQQLIDYKNQLMRTKEDLQRVNQNYSKIVELSSAQETKMNSNALETSKLKESSDGLARTIQTLNMQVDRLAEYQKNLKERDEHIAKLANLILQKDEEIANLKAQLAESQEKLQKAQDAINSLNQSLDEIKSGMNSLRETNVRTKEDYKSIQDKVEILKANLVIAQKRAAIADTQEIELKNEKNENSNFSNQLAQARLDLNKFQSQVKELTSTIEQLNRKLASKDEEIVTLKQKVGQIDEYKKAVEQLRTQLTELTREVGVAHRDLVDYQEKVKQGKKIAADQLTLKIAAKETQINELRQKVQEGARYIEVVKQLQSQVASLSNDVVSFKKQIEELLVYKERAILLEKLIAKHEAAEKLFIEKITLLTQLAQNNQSKAEYYKSEVTKTIAYWQKNSQGNLDQIDGLKKIAQDKQEEVKDLQARLLGNQKQASQLNSMLDVYQKNMDSKDNDIKNKVKEIETLQGDLQTAQESLALRDKELKKVQAYFFELEQHSAAKSKELKIKDDQLANLNKTLQEKDLDLAGLKAQLTSLQDQLRTSANTTKEQFENLKNEKQGTLDKVSQMQAVIAEKDETLKEKEQVLTKVQEELNLSRQMTKTQEDNLKTAQEQLKSQQARIESLSLSNSNELKDKNEQLALLSASLDKKKAELSQALEKLTVLQAQVNHAQAASKLQSENFKKFDQDYKQLALEKLQIKDQLEQHKAKLAGSIERLTVTESKLKTSVDQSELDRTKEILKATQLEVIALQADVKSREISIASLRQNTLNNKAIENELDQAKTKVAKLMEDLYFKDQEAQRLKMKLSLKDKTIKPIMESLSEIKKDERKSQDYERQISKLKNELYKNHLEAEDESGLPVVVDLIRGHWPVKTSVDVYKKPTVEQISNIKLSNNEKRTDISLAERSQIEALKNELKSKDEILARSDAGNDSLKSLRSRLKVALSDFEGARAAAQNKSEQAKALSQEVSKLTAKVNELQKKIDSLQGKEQ